MPVKSSEFTVESQGFCHLEDITRKVDEAVSGSGLEQGMHIIDPRQAKPVAGKLASWSSARDAATADALSTAFMVMSADEIIRYCAGHTDSRALVVAAAEGETGGIRMSSYGAWREGELSR